MSALARFLGAYHRSGLRGSTRITDFLSHKLGSLQEVPVEVDGGTLIADLRIASARGILANPQSQSGEDQVMYQLVRPGDTVFDIGAHLGFYTLLLAKLTGPRGRVIGFEPNPELLPSLKRTTGQAENVEIREMALSDSYGVMDLFVPEDPSMASLSNWTNGRAGHVHTVQCEMAPLDELIENGRLPVPHFVKCDVEGAELAVFRGARKILDKADAPVILFELNTWAASSFGNRLSDYSEFLGSLVNAKYRFFEIDKAGLTELRSTELDYANVLAVPEHRYSDIEVLA